MIFHADAMATYGNIAVFLCLCVFLMCFVAVSLLHWPGHAAFRVFKEETARMGTIWLSGRAARAGCSTLQSSKIQSNALKMFWIFLHVSSCFFSINFRSMEISFGIDISSNMFIFTSSSRNCTPKAYKT